MLKETNRIKKIYNTAYRQNTDNYGYIWHPCNPVSIFYRQAQERSIISILKKLDFKISKLKILDVGCGSGGFLRFMASLGVDPDNLSGLDLMDYRIKEAKRFCPPAVNLCVADAIKLPYKDKNFNLVSQMTAFSAIFDDEIKKNVAKEMFRILKRKGYILWYDMRTHRNDTTLGLEKAEIVKLFPGCELKVLKKMHAPYVSHIAKKSFLLAEIWDHLIFFKKTHYLVLLQKK